MTERSDRFPSSDWAAELPEPEALKFGQVLGPKVVVASHQSGQGWSAPTVVDRAVASPALATGAVQYAISVFEGMKAYRGVNGVPHLFRASDHARRLRASAARLGMPEPPESLLTQMLWKAVDAQPDHLPPQGRGALYLRPTLYAADEALGLKTSSRHDLAVIVTPCSVPERAPIKLWAERELVRAAPGGLGAAKTGANYAASLLGKQRAQARGYDDALWLDARERKMVGEAGTMNVFFVLPDRVLTPKLDGTILEGITRDSVMRLLKEWRISVQEVAIGLNQIHGLMKLGELLEMFGCGTASSVTPIIEIGYDRGEILPSGGKLVERLAKALSAQHDGTAADTYGWRESHR